MIIFTQGDILSLTLICKNTDLTASTFTTIFKGKNGKDVIIPNGQHTADPDQTANKGKLTCALTAANTAAVEPGENLDMIVKVVQAGSTLHFHGRGLLTVRKSTFVK